MKVNEKALNGDIGKPIDNIVMCIGGNPDKGGTASSISDIDVYWVRIYNRGLTEEEIEVNNIADYKRFKNEEIIGISNEEELLNVESGKVYELKNDIEVNGDYTSIINKINNKEVELKSNEYKIINNGKYYTANSKYTVAVNKYGYVIDGLELLLDGKDNEGTGKHNSSATVWKDLSGKNRDGTLINMDINNCWSEDGLNFDGIDDFVRIGEMNYDNITMESIVSYENNKIQDEGMAILSNIEAGGYQIYIDKNKKFAFSVYINEKQDYVQTSRSYQESAKIGNKYYVCGSYDNQKLSLVTSNNNSGGMNYQELYESGTIKQPDNNTKMILGANPNGDNAANYYLKGKNIIS